MTSHSAYEFAQIRSSYVLVKSQHHSLSCEAQSIKFSVITDSQIILSIWITIINFSHDA